MFLAKVHCRWLASALILGAAAASANPPPPPRPIEPAREVESLRFSAPVIVEHKELAGKDRDAKAVIKIPRHLLPELAAKPAAEPRPILPGSAPPKTEKQTSTPYGGTIIAGLTMSLAAVSLVFVLKRGATTRSVAVLLVSLGLAGIAAGTVLADIRVPGQPYRGPARRPEPVPAERVVIEIVEDGDAVVLTLAPEKLEKKPK